MTLGRLSLVLALFSSLAPRLAVAEIIEYRAELSGNAEGNFYLWPPGGTGSEATAVFNATYDTDTDMFLSVTMNVQGLQLADIHELPSQQSHVHEEGGPNRILNIGALGFIDVPGGMTLSAGPVPILSGSEPLLLAGGAYANIHSIEFPAGEISGVLVEITPVPALPPLALAMLALLLTGYAIGSLRLAPNRRSARSQS
jgi:hypothetical protein